MALGSRKGAGRHTRALDDVVGSIVRSLHAVRDLLARRQAKEEAANPGVTGPVGVHNIVTRNDRVFGHCICGGNQGWQRALGDNGRARFALFRQSLQFRDRLLHVARVPLHFLREGLVL